MEINSNLFSRHTHTKNTPKKHTWFCWSLKRNDIDFCSTARCGGGGLRAAKMLVLLFTQMVCGNDITAGEFSDGFEYSFAILGSDLFLVNWQKGKVSESSYLSNLRWFKDCFLLRLGLPANMFFSRHSWWIDDFEIMSDGDMFRLQEQRPLLRRSSQLVDSN